MIIGYKILQEEKKVGPFALVIVFNAATKTICKEYDIAEALPVLELNNFRVIQTTDCFV